MNALRFAACLGLAAAACVARADVAERERNAWPVVVRQFDPAGNITALGAGGPLFFEKKEADGETASGFRPLWVQVRTPEERLRAVYLLYPLFSYTADENTYKWSVFELIRRTDRKANAAPPRSILEQQGEFEIFPFWFSRQTGDPEMNYRGLFPIYGTVKNKFGIERASWTLFPLYAQTAKRGATTTYTPWPIIRVTRGAAHGWGVWPLYTEVERPGVSRSQYYLWPLGFNVTRQPAPDAPAGTGPRRDVGFLPFYTRSSGTGYENRDYLWPFFGYTEREQPVKYSEQRYFWPFFVQGRGDERIVNRWGPFYTHSINKGYDKTWYMWPLVRQAKWNDEGIDRQRTQFAFFLYWSETQRVPGRPSVAPANLTHVWPLFSTWDNGAGQKQWQALSPLDVFFPRNEKIRYAWSPLFALARHEQQAPGKTRTSLLWDAVTWERNESEARKEFHVGPLFSMSARAEERRIAVGNGLFGFKRPANGAGWKFFWLDFPPKPANPTAGSR